MKTIHNFIYEKLKLNNQSQLRKRSENDLRFEQWENQIIKDFSLNEHRLGYSYIIHNIYDCCKQKYDFKTKLKFVHLNPLPSYCVNMCYDILKNGKLPTRYELSIIYKDLEYANTVNIYYVNYNATNIILIIRFKDCLEGEKKYDAYEVYYENN